MKIIEISPIISSKLAVFPGDTPYKYTEILSTHAGNAVTLGKIESTLHLGAHADSSHHYHSAGKDISQRPLLPFLGAAQVIEVQKKSGRIQLADFNINEVKTQRILFKTGSQPDSHVWNSDFVSLSPEVIRALHQKGVLLVGIDTPSVDPETSKELPSHQALFETEMCVLEGLDLTDAMPSIVYTLIALPLRIEGADASPVRAVLVENFNT